jgi:hypothetical protein
MGKKEYKVFVAETTEGKEIITLTLEWIKTQFHRCYGESTHIVLHTDYNTICLDTRLPVIVNCDWREMDVTIVLDLIIGELKVVQFNDEEKEIKIPFNFEFEDFAEIWQFLFEDKILDKMQKQPVNKWGF